MRENAPKVNMLFEGDFGAVHKANDLALCRNRAKRPTDYSTVTSVRRTDLPLKRRTRRSANLTTPSLAA